MASALGLRRSAYSGERGRPVVVRLAQAAVELDDVLERAVHALAEERDDGVGGVAEQAQPTPDPRPDPDGDERADRVPGELAGQVLEPRRGVRVVTVEAGPDGVGRVQPGEPRVALEGPEQGGGEAAVGVGQGDHHRVAPGPDVERARIEREPARRVRRDRQLLVPPRQVLLAVVGALAPDHRLPHRAVRAVGTDDDLVGDGVAAAGALQRQLAGLGHDDRRPLLEVEHHAGLLGRGVEQQRVEPVPGDRVDGLRAVRAVGLVGQLAGAVVHHPAPHGQPVAHDILGEADPLEGVDAAGREREVDRASRRAGEAGVRATLVQRDVVAAPRQVDGQQGTGQAGAGDPDVSHRPTHSARAAGSGDRGSRGRCRRAAALRRRAGRRTSG